MLLPEEPGKLAAGGSCAEVAGAVAPALTVRDPAGVSAGLTEGVLEAVVPEGPGADSSAASRDASEEAGAVAPAFTVRDSAGASAGRKEGVLEAIVPEGPGADSSAASRDASMDMVEGRGWFLQNCTDGWTLYR